MLLDFSLSEYTAKAQRQAEDIAQQFSIDTDFRDPTNVARLAAYYVEHGLITLNILIKMLRPCALPHVMSRCKSLHGIFGNSHLRCGSHQTIAKGGQKTLLIRS